MSMCSTLIKIQEKWDMYSLPSRIFQFSWADRHWPLLKKKKKNWSVNSTRQYLNFFCKKEMNVTFHDLLEFHSPRCYLHYIL